MTTKKFTPKHKTNKTTGSLVKVVVSNDTGKWLTPPAAAAFVIDAAAIFPVIDFEIETQEAGPYAWSWSISWDAKTSGLRESAKRGSTLRKFADKGSHSSKEKKWRTDLSKVIGGKLRVEVLAGKVGSCVSSTVAPGMPSPFWLVTVPSNTLVVTWAREMKGRSRRRKRCFMFW